MSDVSSNSIFSILDVLLPWKANVLYKKKLVN